MNETRASNQRRLGIFNKRMSKSVYIIGLPARKKNNNEEKVM